MSNLERIYTERKTGSEPFHNGKRELDFNMLDFWRWSASDLISNTSRGVLAEYLIANAINAAEGVREEWAPYDLDDPRGISIEVKSAAYIQSWSQEKYSSIIFNCPKTLAWDPETNRLGTEKLRQAQVYVFALLACKDQSALDPLDVSQWEFYVVPTVLLNRRERSQHSISLKSLQDLHGEPVVYDGLRDAIWKAALYK